MLLPEASIVLAVLGREPRIGSRVAYDMNAYSCQRFKMFPFCPTPVSPWTRVLMRFAVLALSTTSSVHRILPACTPLPVDPKQPKDALYALQGPLPFSAFMRDTKRQAIAHLATALGGDALAAEYALLTILSRAYVRTEVRQSGEREFF